MLCGGRRLQQKHLCQAFLSFSSLLFRFRSIFPLFPQKRLLLRLHELGLARGTGIDWDTFCREVCEITMFDSSQKIGGEGKIVQIDESKFGKRKYHQGHHVEGQWVFGGIEQESRKCFMIAVDKRDEATLLPLIKRVYKACRRRGNLWPCLVLSRLCPVLVARVLSSLLDFQVFVSPKFSLDILEAFSTCCHLVRMRELDTRTPRDTYFGSPVTFLYKVLSKFRAHIQVIILPLLLYS